MKIAHPLIMYAFITACLMSCMAVKSVHKTAPIPIELVEVVVPSPKKIDTIKKDTTKQIQAETRKQLVLLSNKVVDNTLPSDSVRKLNYKLQELLFTMFNRGVKRADKNDSLAATVKALVDTLNARDKRDMKFRQAQAKVVQVEKVNKATFSMFNLIILVCLVICTIHALLQLIPWAWYKLFPNKITYE